MAKNQEPIPSQPLIPGLPDEISELCLLHLPYPYQTLARSVSSSWNKTITNPSFHLQKKSLSLSSPYVFVLASEKSTDEIRWQAFDPRSNRWFVLPPMPCPEQSRSGSNSGSGSGSCSPLGFGSTSVSKQGVLYVLGGMAKSTESSLSSLITYSTSTNRWCVASSPMLTARSFFKAVTINGQIYAAGGYGERLHHTVSTVECYDPETDTWKEVANMRSGFAHFDAVVKDKKMYVREATMAQELSSFKFPPRGGMYDQDSDTWEVMSRGMREGWSGTSVVLHERVFMISRDEECRMKVYESDSDTWRDVGGGQFPSEAVQGPFVVSGVEGRVYVVALGLIVVVGRLSEEGPGGSRQWRVEWEVVKAPEAFRDFIPCTSQVVYG